MERGWEEKRERGEGRGGREDGERRGGGDGRGKGKRMERGEGGAAADTDKAEDANLQIKCLTRFK